MMLCERWCVALLVCLPTASASIVILFLLTLFETVF
jgi:hypothetical protein